MRPLTGRGSVNYVSAILGGAPGNSHTRFASDSLR
jgi:hypothetical protein